MFTIRKMKPAKIYMIFLVPLGLLSVSIFFSMFFDMAGFFIPIGIFFWVLAVYNFILFLRTQYKKILVLVAFFFDAGILSFSIIYLNRGGDCAISILFLFATLFFLVWTINLTLNKKLKFRGRDILELAAQPVEGADNGFTGRPFPVGKTQYDSHQILDFTEFVRENMLALPFVGNDRVVFVQIMPEKEMSFVLGLKSDFSNTTWIAFEFDGNVTVNISRRDFYNFVEMLSFEQLNESLGNLWIEFIEMYRHGDGKRIAERLNQVSPIFSF